MKIKYSNRVIIILNIIMSIILSFLINILANNLTIKLSMLGIYGETEKLSLIQNIMFIILIIANIINAIINIKNKKYVVWSLIPIIFFIELLFINLDLNKITDVFYDLWCIIPGVIFIIALIVEVLKNKRKKNIIFYTLAIILSIIIILIEEISDLASVIWFIISAIMMFIYTKESIDDNKAKRIIAVTLLGIIITFGAFYIARVTVMIAKLYEIDRETVQFIEQIREGLENEDLESNELILVNRNNKWGYINKDGEEIVPCQYDVISDYNSMLTFYKIVVAKKEDTYHILTRNGKLLATSVGRPLPFVNEKWEEDTLKENENNYTYFLVGVQNILLMCLDEYDTIEQSSLNLSLSLSSYVEDIPYEDMYGKTYYINPVSHSYNEKFNSVYEYELKNGEKLYVEEFEDDEGEEKYNIQIKRNNQIIETIENVEMFFGNTSEGEGAILTYISGDIPFVDTEKGIQGYYSINEGMSKYLGGKYQILDKKDDLIVVRDYNNPNNVRDYIMNSITGEVLYIAKNISAYQCGYVIQKYNNKVVYCDNQLNEVTREFDLICLVENGEVLICGDNSNNGEYVVYTEGLSREDIMAEGIPYYNREYSLYDIEGNRLTDYTYQVMKDEFLNKQYSGKNYILDIYY